MNRLLAISRTERLLLLAFISFSIVDMFLTIQLVKNGFLATELMPGMRKLFTVFGPPNYSHWVFVIAKVFLTAVGVFVILRMAKVTEKTRTIVFVLPALSLCGICMINLVGLVS